MASSNSITIVPGKAASLATVLRGYINVAMGSMRVKDADSMEKAIADMRRTMTALETELRLNVQEV